MPEFREPPPPNTFLLTWNPKLWTWVNLDAEVQATSEGRSIVQAWSTGVTKKIAPDDRVFLVHLGREPRGIMGSGVVISDIKEGPHLDRNRAADGVTYRFAMMAFDCLLNPKLDRLLTLNNLNSGGLASVKWTPQASGTEIKTGVMELERLWREHVAMERLSADDPEMSAMEGAIRLMMVRHRSRERYLRDAKIAEYKAVNNGRLPCEVCGLDFLEFYGEMGRDYAHVHHDRPLAELVEPARTTPRDLRVVCANCHAMIHRAGEVRSVASLVISRPN